MKHVIHQIIHQITSRLLNVIISILCWLREKGWPKSLGYGEQTITHTFIRIQAMYWDVHGDQNHYNSNDREK